MSLTEAQRRRMEENRERAHARLREKRARQSPASSAAEERIEEVESGRRSRVDGAGGEADAGRGGDPPPRNSEDPEHRHERGREQSRSSTADPGRTGGSSLRGGTSTRAGGGGGGGTARSDGGRGRGADGAAADAAVCEGCAGAEGDDRVDKELLEGFGITVCRACKLKNEDFQCVTKREAKDTYLLPEGTIAVLKFIERDNPRHSSWTKMKLYLRRDVAAYSYKRWGSEDGLEEERNRRDSLKFDRSLSRTKGVFKRSRSEAKAEGGVLLRKEEL